MIQRAGVVPIRCDGLLNFGSSDMTATLRKWATDLMVGAGIAVLGLVLLVGSGTALGVTPANPQCPPDGTGVACQFTEKVCDLTPQVKGRCGISAKFGCDCTTQ